MRMHGAGGAVGGTLESAMFSGLIPHLSENMVLIAC
jgi:hypothetical protein